MISLIKQLLPLLLLVLLHQLAVKLFVLNFISFKVERRPSTNLFLLLILLRVIELLCTQRRFRLIYCMHRRLWPNGVPRMLCQFKHLPLQLRIKPLLLILNPEVKVVGLRRCNNHNHRPSIGGAARRGLSSRWPLKQVYLILP